MYDNYRQCFIAIARELILNGDFVRAEDCLDEMDRQIPEDILPYPNDLFRSQLLEMRQAIGNGR